MTDITAAMKIANFKGLDILARAQFMEGFAGIKPANAKLRGRTTPAALLSFIKTMAKEDAPSLSPRWWDSDDTGLYRIAFKIMQAIGRDKADDVMQSEMADENGSIFYAAGQKAHLNPSWGNRILSGDLGPADLQGLVQNFAIKVMKTDYTKEKRRKRIEEEQAAAIGEESSGVGGYDESGWMMIMNEIFSQPDHPMSKKVFALLPSLTDFMSPTEGALMRAYLESVLSNEGKSDAEIAAENGKNPAYLSLIKKKFAEVAANVLADPNKARAPEFRRIRDMLSDLSFLNALLRGRVPGSRTAALILAKARKLASLREAAQARALSASDYAALLDGRQAKFPAGKSMTIDEVAEVVGPEFKEMNENPPASVQKLMAEMGKKARLLDAGRGNKGLKLKKGDEIQITFYDPADAEPGPVYRTYDVLAIRGREIDVVDVENGKKSTIDMDEYTVKDIEKVASSGRVLISADVFADALKESKFEKGKPADPTENMSAEDAAEWERQNELNKDQFKTAASVKVGSARDLVKLIENSRFSIRATTQALQEIIKGIPNEETVYKIWGSVDSRDDFDGVLTISGDGSYSLETETIPGVKMGGYLVRPGEKNVSLLESALSDVRDLNYELVKPNRAIEKFRGIRAASAKVAYPLMEKMQLLSAFQVLAMGTPQAYGVSRKDALAAIEKITGKTVPEDAKPTGKNLDDYLGWLDQIGTKKASDKTAATASGLYGFTKSAEKSCTGAATKLAKFAAKLAKELYTKDVDTAPFMEEHAKRGSKAAKMLRQEMSNVGPGAAPKTAASKSGMGLYGFKEKTAKLAMDACSELQMEAGRQAADIAAKFGEKHATGADFLKKHAKAAKCGFSDLILDSYPASPVKVSEKPAAKMASFDPTVDEILAWDRSLGGRSAASFLASEETGEDEDGPDSV